LSFENNATAILLAMGIFQDFPLKNHRSAIGKRSDVSQRRRGLTLPKGNNTEKRGVKENDKDEGTTKEIGQLRA
jgi:hypothetical protein